MADDVFLRPQAQAMRAERDELRRRLDAAERRWIKAVMREVELERKLDAAREALSDTRAGFRRIIKHHRDDHHHGDEPYDYDIATALLHCERMLLELDASAAPSAPEPAVGEGT